MAPRLKKFHGNNTGQADRAIEELHAQRLKGIAAGTWPTWNFDEWHRQALDARRRQTAGYPISPADHRAFEIVDAITKATKKGRYPRTAA